MKKIFIIIVCAGMTIGLLMVGGVGKTGSNGFNKAAAMPNPSTAITCAASLCSLDEVITNRVFSLSLNGYENYKFPALQEKMNSLKVELSELEVGTKEYNEKIAEIHHTLGLISVILGEINSCIGIETEKLLEMSIDKQTDYEFVDILYIADTE